MLFLALFAILLGLSVSFYIFKKKQTKTSLICPREGSCDKVVHSTHGSTFGIGNEVLGIIFYVAQAALWIGYSFMHARMPGVYIAILVVLTLIGVLFSVYLVALQALVIRAWCAWCLGSAAATLFLGVALFGLPHTALFAFLAHTKLVWVVVHNIGFILGLGGATITDVFFFRFLRDGVITENEKETMDLLSQIIWIGLAVLIVSGVLLVLPDQARLFTSPKFLLKVIVVGVIAINGVLLNIRVAPRMRSLTLQHESSAMRFRRLAFALGAISVTSWYTAFLLGSVRSMGFALREGLALYVALLLTAIIGSQVYERIKSRKTSI